jgi:geranylgeranyl reductase family protein
MMSRWVEEFDVVVVGAGPAGATAALAATRKGARVLIIDKRKQIGVPVESTELVAAPFLRVVPITNASIVQRTTDAVTHLPSGDTHEVEAPGAMLDRSIFDQELAAAAVCAGAELWSDAIFEGFGGEGSVVMTREGVTGRVVAKATVGADGARSSVGPALGLVNTRFIVAKYVEMLLTGPLEKTHVFFDRRFYGHFGWIFPKGESAILGVAVDGSRAATLDNALECMVSIGQDSGFVIGRHVLRRVEGVIPVGGPLGAARVGTVLLAGAAAGQSHPVTGAGLRLAVSCGRIAGEAAGRFVSSGDERDLEGYVEEWRALWGDAFRHALSRRRELLSRWDDDLDAAVKRCWVFFTGYHES